MASCSCENASIADPLDKRLVFVTGKGGVGKTTVAYSLGLAAAAAGKCAIVCEISAQDRGARIFGKKPGGFNEERLADGLWTISIGFEEATKDYLETQMPVRSMGSVLARSHLFSYLAAATPGLQEMVTMGKVWEIAHPERRAKNGERIYDVVIVDAPATGHGITFLRTPGEFRRLARVGPLSSQAGRIEDTLADEEACGVVIVARPEEMAVSEALLLDEQLGRAGEGLGLAIDRHFVNGLYPERFEEAELKKIGRLASGDGAKAAPARPALGAALAEAARSATQREQLDRLSEGASAAITELPYLFESEIGPDQIEELSEILA